MESLHRNSNFLLRLQVTSMELGAGVIWPSLSTSDLWSLSCIRKLTVVDTKRSTNPSIERRDL